MYGRACLRHFGQGRSGLRVFARQSKRSTQTRFYSEQGISEKDEQDRQDELRSSGDDSPDIGVPYSQGNIATIRGSRDAQKLKSRTATQPEEEDIPPQWPAHPSRSPPVDEIRRRGIDAAEDDNLGLESKSAASQGNDGTRSTQRTAANSKQVALPKGSTDKAWDPYGLLGDEADDQLDQDEEDEGLVEAADADEQEEMEGGRDSEEENGDTLQSKLTMLELYDREDITPVNFDPAETSRNTYLHAGKGVSTIAAKNFEGVVQDRMKMVTEIRQDGLRYAPTMARKMMRGAMLSFNSAEERDAVEKEAERYALSIQRSASAVRRGDPDAVSEHRFSPLPESMQTGVVDRYVRGRYVSSRHTEKGADGNRLGESLWGSALKGNGISQHVTKSLMRNGTYLDSDISKMVARVAGLTQPPQRQATARPSTKR